MAGKFMVAGNAIIEKDGKVLITRRNPKRWLGNVWEFVSGRIEQGEDLVIGLKREVREEVSLEIEPLFPIYTTHFYRGEKKAENEVIMVTYVCRYVSGEITLKTDEQVEFRWASPSELTQYESLMKYFAEEINEYGKLKR